MRSLPPELPDRMGGGSPFDDFLPRLRPYPAPPGFRVALLYAVAGSALTLLAAGAAALLPSGESVEGDGFHAVGATSLASVLEAFDALALPFAVLGAAGLVATAIVAAIDRPTALAGGVLIAPPVIGVVSALCVGIGWLLLFIVTAANLLLWLAAVALIGVGLVLLARGQLLVAVVVGALGFAAISALEDAASGPVTGSHTGEPPDAPGRSVDPAPSPAEPRQERWQVKRKRRAQRRAERRRRLARKRRALGRRRTALKQRMDAEYAAWQQVPYAVPCDESDRRVELESLRDQFSEMKAALRIAQRNGGSGEFRQARKELDRVAHERERALADPYGFHDRFGRCPSGPGAMAFLW